MAGLDLRVSVEWRCETLCVAGFPQRVQSRDMMFHEYMGNTMLSAFPSSVRWAVLGNNPREMLTKEWGQSLSQL